MADESNPPTTSALRIVVSVILMWIFFVLLSLQRASSLCSLRLWIYQKPCYYPMPLYTCKGSSMKLDCTMRTQASLIDFDNPPTFSGMSLTMLRKLSQLTISSSSA
ncbi:hypothetical protein PoB_007246700 [Plakobranchus ocellatus]|uniref:Uncharacterized protein n=1 Tax=Plakobranchus ocellatus TaxID=259542 RepID=A0AAV4DNM9_9GAST|nr:hypothetical protein PoB_007246700 [Plakobranchus ocellatus]